MTDAQQLAQTLHKVGLTQGLRDADVKRLLACFVLREVPAGTLICREGRPGDAMTIIQSGLVAVTKRGPGGDQEELARLGVGSIIGEVAMLDGQLCSANVSALSATRLYCFPVTSWVQLRLSGDPALYKFLRNLVIMLCGRLRLVNQRLDQLRADPARQLALLRATPSAHAVAEHAALLTAPGAMHALRGVGQPIKPSPPLRGGADPLVVPSYVPGDGHPDSTLTEKFLRQLPLFQGLNPYELSELAATLLEERRPDGDVVCHQGDRGGDFYIIAQGEVEVRREGLDGQPQVLACLRAGAMFGAISLIDGGSRSATCVTRGPVTLLALARREFEGLFNTDSKLAFHFVEIIGIDLSLCLRSTDEKLALLLANIDVFSPEFRQELDRLRASLQMHGATTVAVTRAMLQNYDSDA